MSKEFVWFDTDLNVLYTFVGGPGFSDVLEVSLAGELHLRESFGVEAEGVVSTGALTGHAGGVGGLGGSRPGVGSSERGGSEGEATLGVAEHLTERLKIEQGVTLKSDGAVVGELAWEFDFAG